MNPLLLTDFYKVHHKFMLPKGLTSLYETGTPRGSRFPHIDYIIVAGLQWFVLKYLIKEFNEHFFFTEYRNSSSLLSYKKKGMMEKYKRHIKLKSYDHIEALFDLGYLPIEIKSLDEGTKCPVRVPFYTIKETHPDFAWLVGYIETLMSCCIWQMFTSATLAFDFKKLLIEWANKTDQNNIGFVNWQGHDFSMRGMSSPESAILSGMGHLFLFEGTDTVPALYQLEESYDYEDYDVDHSIPATEHSIQCSHYDYLTEDESAYFEHILTEYPEGPVAMVGDGFNLWKFIMIFLVKFKDRIMSREGKLVIRPDSGNPVDIICGKISRTLGSVIEIGYFLAEFYHEMETKKQYFIYDGNVFSVERDRLEEVAREYGIDQMFEFGKHTTIGDVIDGGRYSYITPEKISIEESKGVIELLWDIFGGTVNEQGYKVLDSHIGAIYGDAINRDRALQIFERLEAKGFASTNIVFGIGSYTYQYNTRDTFKFAMKGTYCEFQEEFWASPESLEPGIRTVRKEMFKDPITDNGFKKSAKGLVRVDMNNKGELVLKDQCTKEEEQDGLLTTLFKDGVLVKRHSLTQIREKINSYL